MASRLKRGRSYLVRWRDPDGRERGRSCPDLDTARRLQLEVERTVALGRRWEPPDARAVPVLLEVGQDDEGNPVAVGGLFHDFLHVARSRVAPGTYRHYDRALRRFFVWLAEKHRARRRIPCDLLTRDAVEAWFGALISEPPPPSEHPQGRRQHPRPLGISSARLHVDAVLEAWRWGHDSDDYGDVVLRPRRPELPTVVGAPPVAPSWAQMDAVIAAAWSLAVGQAQSVEGWTWRARALTVMRCTGLRSSQVMRLRWDDVDVDRAILTVRGELGKSKAERQGRTVPLAPTLVEQLAGWGRREGWLVAPVVPGRRGGTHRVLEAVHLLDAWRAARLDGQPLPERLYGVRPGRAKGQAGHAFRAGFKTGLARLGVDSRVRDLLVGHHAAGMDAHYLDLWDQAVDAVRLVPALPVVERTVVPFRRA